VVAAVVAYAAGISAARLLGAKVSSFVGLSEVLFAVLFAWLLLGQLPGGLQFLGGVFILGGVALVRVDELRAPAIEAGAGELVAAHAGQNQSPLVASVDGDG
jgi:drug/metabolite transporter (DMT)-like permease